jgi:hypothetical protein
VDDLQRGTASMSDEQLALPLASDLREHAGVLRHDPPSRGGAVRNLQDRPGTGADGSGDMIWTHVVQVMSVRRLPGRSTLRLERVGGSQLGQRRT